MLSPPTISCGSKLHKFIVYCVNHLSQINLTSFIKCFLVFVFWVLKGKSTSSLYAASWLYKLLQLANLEISLCLPCPDFGRLTQYFSLQKPYCHFPNRLFLHALSLNSHDRLCHLTCDRSQAHWFVVPRTLSRAQKWQDTHKEPLKPIATKEYYVDCQKVLIPQPKQISHDIKHALSINSYVLHWIGMNRACA